MKNSIPILLIIFTVLLLTGCADSNQSDQIGTPKPTQISTQTEEPSIGEIVVDKPEEEKILFLSDRNGDTGIFLMDIDGQNIQEIALQGLPENVLIDRPIWSPALDMFFMGVSNGSNGEIFSFYFDGSGLRNLTNTSKRYEANPIPHPSGDQILYTLVDLDLDIGVMNPDGSNPVNLTFHPARDTNPKWLGDSNEILFSSNRHGTPNIFTMTSDGSDITNISQGRGQDHLSSMSSDGNEIYFDSDRDGAKDLFVINLRTNEIKNLTSSDDIRETEPLISPNGEMIAYYTQTEESRDIYIINTDGSDPRQLTFTPAQYELGLNWSLNSQYLLFTSQDNDQYDIFKIDVDTGEITQMTDDPSDDYAPLWINFED